MTYLKKKIRNVFYKCLSRLIPEISVLKKNITWNNLINYKSGSLISTKAKINNPSNLSCVYVDNYSYIDQNSFISNTSIGKFCSIGPNFFCGWGIHPTNGLSTAPMFYSTKKQNGYTLSSVDKIEERKQITIGNDVFIGANVTVLDGITIGDGAIIGAGAIVSKDIPPYCIAVGSPIKVVKKRFEDHQIEALLKIKWWNFDEDKLKDVEHLFFDIDAFINKYEL